MPSGRDRFMDVLPYVLPYFGDFESNVLPTCCPTCCPGTYTLPVRRFASAGLSRCGSAKCNTLCQDVKFESEITDVLLLGRGQHVGQHV